MGLLGPFPYTDRTGPEITPAKASPSCSLCWPGILPGCCTRSCIITISLFYSMGLILLWFLWISCYTSETDGIATHWRVISYPTVHPLQIQLRNQRIRFNSRENNLSFRGSAVVDIVIKPQYCFRERSTVTGNSLFKKLETTI